MPAKTFWHILPSGRQKIKLTPYVTVLFNIYVGLPTHGCQSARELTAATWGQDLARTLSRCESILNKMSEEFDSSAAEQKQMLQLAARLKTSLYDVWKEASADVFDVG